LTLAGSLLDLCLQIVMREIVFSDDHQASRIFVQTMHDTGTEFAADTGELGTVREQGIDEGSFLGTGGGMHDHPLRLVQYEKVLVLENDVERNGFRGDGTRTRRQNRRGNQIADLCFEAGFDTSAVHINRSGVNQPLYLCARDVGELTSEIGINPFSLLSFGDNKREFPSCFHILSLPVDPLACCWHVFVSSNS
jgi:hypothetical protein